MQFHVRVVADISAVLGIIARRGVGKVRNMDTNLFWIRGTVARKTVEYDTVVGAADPADFTITEPSTPDMEEHTQTMGACFVEGGPGIVARMTVDEAEPFCDRPGDATPVAQGFVIAGLKRRPEDVDYVNVIIAVEDG